MECVRRYQLAHPEAATEVMNWLAQAFNELCQPKTGSPATITKPDPPEIALVEIAPSTLPPRGETVADVPFRPIEPTDNPPLPPIMLEGTAEDPVLETARSPAARRGLVTKRAIYQRISTTRMLIRAWVQAGQYLADPGYKLRTKEEALDLARQLTIIRQQLQSFPTLVGQAGQPGYYVISLARQPRIVQTFQALSPSERDGLVHDWEAGLRFLAAHRLFLRHEIEDLRGQSWLRRLGRPVLAFFTDYPVVWLFLLGLLALNIAHPPLRADWPRQLVIIGAGLAVFLLYQAYRNWERWTSLQRRRRVREKLPTVIEAKKA